LQFLEELLENFGAVQLEYLKPFIPCYTAALTGNNKILKVAAAAHLEVAVKWNPILVDILGEVDKKLLEKLRNIKDEGHKMKPRRGGKKTAKGPQKSGPAQVESSEEEIDDDDEDAVDMEGVDPYDMVEPYDIFKKFNETWCEKTHEIAKWNEKAAEIQTFLDVAKAKIKMKPTSHSHFLDFIKKNFKDGKNANIAMCMIKI
jgi:hypothetical protein